MKILVVPAGEDCYLAVDKGAITDQHVLVLPVEHFPSSLTFSPAAYEEMERYAGPCVGTGGGTCGWVAGWLACCTMLAVEGCWWWHGLLWFAWPGDPGGLAL